MALCLAESILEAGWDPVDQLERYVRWMEDGLYSSTGRCFDIGRTVLTALGQFRRTGEPFPGSTDPNSAGNGSIMRLAPVALRYAHNRGEAIARAADSSRTTHGAPTAIDACRYLSALIVGALEGRSKQELLADDYFTAAETPAIRAVAAGSYKTKAPPHIRGSGYVVESLEAALWAFDRSTSFEEGALMAVCLGNDADTTGAVFGQLAGAFYGQDGIPIRWRQRLAMRETISNFADRLHAAACMTAP